jgi:hypothetical protein
MHRNTHSASSVAVTKLGDAELGAVAGAVSYPGLPGIDINVSPIVQTGINVGVLVAGVTFGSVTQIQGQGVQNGGSVGTK